MLINIRRPKSGTSLIVTDPRNEIHACANADELWKTIQELIDDPEMPAEQVTGAPSSRAGADADDFVRDVTSELGGRVLGGVLDALRGASHRHKPAKNGKVVQVDKEDE